MKIHTSDFKTNMKTVGRELNALITYNFNNETIILDAEDLNIVTPNVNGNILKSVMKELDIDSNKDIPLGTIINFKFGIRVNRSFEYLDYGNYVVYSSNKCEDTNSYNIKCYDKILYSMKEYDNLNTKYPITVREYINLICKKIGLQFANINEMFANYEKVISKDLYANLGYTYRDILDELAQVTASTICINKDDKLEIRYINDTNDVIDEEFFNADNVNFGKKYGPINSIVLSRSAESDSVCLKDDESIETNGLCEIKIIDNQIMNWNDRDTFLTDILEKLNGLEYYTNDFVSKGICYYDLCDKFQANIGNMNYPCILFNDEVIIDQGITENIFTDMPTETQTDYSKADKTDKRINQVYIIANKQEKRIDAVVSEQKQIEKDITTSKPANGNPIEITDAGEYPLERMIIEFESNNTSIDQESNIIILKPILSFNQTLKYESYTGGIPSPNAKYPKEIETVQGVTNYFDNKFRQGTESGETSPIYIFSKSNINLKKGSYVFKTNLDLSKYFYAVFGNTNKFPNSVQQTYNSGWKSNNTFSFNFSQDLYFGILIKKKDNSNITPKELENFKFQLEKGTIAHDYVPYGRWINQKTIGINKFNGETESGSYNSQTGLKVNNSAATRNKYPIEVESNKDYIFSNDGVWVGMNVFEYDNNYNLIKYSIITDYVGQFFTTTEKTRYINFFRSNTNVDKVQLNLGKEVLPYESYKENTALIDMNKENLFDKSLFDSFTHNLKYINLKLKPNTIYTLFSNLPTQGTIYNLFFYTKGGSANSDYNGVSENNPISAMSDSEGYVTIAYRDYNNLLTNEIENYYYNLYEGYEPHYEFAQLDEAKDIFDNGTLIKNTDKLIFNGDTEENWHLMSDSSYQSDDCLCVWKNLNFNITSNDIFCSHFKCVLTIPDFKLNLNKIYINPNYNQLFINIPKTLVPDLASFKVWLKNQYDVGTPVVFYYQLAEPQTYQLPYEPLKLHKGYNYITLNDDLYPNMQIEYLTDSKFNANYATKSELKMKSNEITLGVEGKLKNYSTTTETHAMVDAIVEEESAKVEISVSQKIEDIQIGGTNLLRDTQNFGRNGVSANTMGYLMRFSSVEETTKYQGLTIRTLASTNTTLIMAQYYVNNCKNGEEYTTSFYAKGNGSLRAYFYGPSGYIPVSEILVDGKKGILNSDGRADIQLTGGWKRYNIVYKLADTGGTTDVKYLLFRNDNAPTAWSMCGLKLEKGNKDTDWSSAPEDKLDNSKFTKAELVLKLNSNESNAKLSADIIDLVAAKILNILAGNEINLTANNISIGSKYTFFDSNGNFVIESNPNDPNSGKFEIKDGKNPNKNITSLISSGFAINRFGTNYNFYISSYSQVYDPLFGSSEDPLHFYVTAKHKKNSTEYESEIAPNFIAVTTYDADGNGVFTKIDSNKIMISGKPVITGTYGYDNSADVLSLAMIPNSNGRYLEIVTKSAGTWGINAWASDKRLKRRVKDSKYNALDTIMKIKHRQFIYRKSNEKVLIGYVADELQEIDPNMVFEVGPQKIKQPSESYIIPILSMSIQQQQKIIKNQDKRITELENQVKKLLELVEGNKE